MKRFVTFEGIDGSGKSTVSQQVYHKLQNQGVDVVLTVEPTDNEIGMFVQQCIEAGADPFVTTFAFLADRIQHGLEIQRHLDKGTLVLCDRYVDSTIAYQSAQLESHVDNPMKWLKELSRPRIPKPDRTFLFVIEPKQAIQRIQHRESLIPFEKEQFLNKVAKNYLKLSTEKRFKNLDATKPVEQLVSECIKDILE